MTVPEDTRRRAARLHLTVFALGLLLALPLRARRAAEDGSFLAHHAHQATCLTLTLLLLEGVHGLLHLGIFAVRRFLAWVEAGVGDPSPLWMVEALGVAHTLNWSVMALEVTAAMVMTTWMSRRARAGHSPTYFFAWDVAPPPPPVSFKK